MKTPRIAWALLGGGAGSLIGVVHRIAAAMGEDFQLVAGVFSADAATGERFARELGLDASRSYASVDALIAGESSVPASQRVRCVTVATPNHLHFDQACKLIRAGFHVICEKPMTATAAEARELQELLDGRQVAFALAHTYTGYPMVRQMRSMIRDGRIGRVQKVDVQYYQGWINPAMHDAALRRSIWRLDPAVGGQSCCIGDIGVHAFNLLEYMTGLSVQRVLADLDTLYSDNALDVDGSVLLHFGQGVKGVLCASQIATAEENDLRIAVYGRSGALKWAQETPNRLHYLQEAQPCTVLTPGHAYNSELARASSKLPPGHPEGFIDAMGNIYRGVATAIDADTVVDEAIPSIQAGVRGMRFVEAVLASARHGNVWTAL